MRSAAKEDLAPLQSAEFQAEIDQTWGYAVVAQAKKFGYIFGVGKARHYHGTAKGFMQVEPFDLVICG